MSNKKISINIATTVLQVIITGILYYSLYKLILNKLGSDILGVWSIVLATSSIASIGGVGFTASLVKFIAEFLSIEKKIDKLLFTSLLCTFIFYFLFSIILFFIGPFILGKVIDNQFIILACKILPISIFILQVNAIATVFLSILEGFQKNYLKNIVIAVSNFCFLLFTYFFFKFKISINSVIYAQLIQAMVSLVLAFIFAGNLSGYKYLFRWNWSKTIFKEIFSYSLKFQIISICQILYDPITKGLLGKFSGLQTVAYYEMANRMVMQIRGVIINANQVIVPIIASAKQTSTDYIVFLYKRSLKIITFFSLITTIIVVAASSIISKLWIGYLNYEFIFFTIILSIIYFFNILSGPAYFGNIGEGRLNKLLAQHISVAIINVVGGVFLSIYGIDYGAVWAWGLSVVAGACYIILDYHNNKKITYSILFSENDSFIFFVGLVCLSIIVILNQFEIKVNSVSFTFFILKLSLILCFLATFYFKKRSFINNLVQSTFDKIKSI